MTGTEDPSTSAMISRMLVARPPGVFRRRITTSTRRSPAVVSASFTYLTVAGPIAPSISIVSAGLPLSSAERSTAGKTGQRQQSPQQGLPAPFSRQDSLIRRYMGVVFPRLNRTDARGLLIAARPRRRRDVWVFPKELLNADHSGQGPVSGGMRRD